MIENAAVLLWGIVHIPCYFPSTFVFAQYKSFAITTCYFCSVGRTCRGRSYDSIVFKQGYLADSYFQIELKILKYILVST